MVAGGCISAVVYIKKRNSLEIFKQRKNIVFVLGGVSEKTEEKSSNVNLIPSRLASQSQTVANDQAQYRL